MEEVRELARVREDTPIGVREAVGAGDGHASHQESYCFSVTVVVEVEPI